jgi:hypothetical protein
VTVQPGKEILNGIKRKMKERSAYCSYFPSSNTETQDRSGYVYDAMHKSTIWVHFNLFMRDGP